ncbi:DNA ligase D [Polluticoccus soli]|uniref:DNA ligase D n=1 Tax=Polluticoccus soli TaxID=3034150 RepID=UPI0023E17B2C|nr:DNA ligase D [Flavipsychrobacter sp. JY13-12]
MPGFFCFYTKSYRHYFTVLPCMSLKELLKGGTRGQMPGNVLPMLATLVDKAPEQADWLYEVKWDGYRAISFTSKTRLDIRSRNNKSFNEKFYPVYNALKELGINAVLDGEIIVPNDEGVSDFQALQQWRSEADGGLVYYVFDILWLNGVNLMNLPLARRRDILHEVLPDGHDVIKNSSHFDTSPDDFMKIAEAMGMEGVIAKKTDSVYVPDSRSKDWLKIKVKKYQEVIICGYTKNEGSSKQFSALMLGLYDHGELISVGPVGTGFNTKMQTELLKKLKPLITKRCPFKVVPDYNKPSRFRPNPPKAEVTWVKPQLVAEISYAEITSDGAIRHPSFKGLREDKDPKTVTWERTKKTTDVVKSKRKKIVIEKPSKDKERRTLLNPSEEMQVREVNGNQLKFTNLSKVYWPAEKYTKRDMINYYYQVAPFMLPYMKDRPQTLNRHPNGINGKTFYQKNVTGKVPEWIETFPYYSETDQEEKNFLVCTNEASLLYIASLGCIEMNPWHSRTKKPDNPDYCIIDLDPDKNTFEQVIKAAQVTKEVLDAFGIPCYCKTSGSTGLHIYIPLGAKYNYEHSKEFGRIVARIVHEELPGFTSIERATKNRQGKMYVDFLQNRPQATIAAPYSIRPKPGATVSAPLHWDEVKKGMKMKDFTIRTMPSRLAEVGDLFNGVLDKGIDMKKVVKSIAKLNDSYGRGADKLLKLL